MSNVSEYGFDAISQETTIPFRAVEKYPTGGNQVHNKVAERRINEANMSRTPTNKPNDETEQQVVDIMRDMGGLDTLLNKKRGGRNAHMNNNTEQQLPTRTVDCPRCYDGTDPRLRPEQSCLICWGKQSIDIDNQAWSHQHSKTLEHIMLHPMWNTVKGKLRGV